MNPIVRSPAARLTLALGLVFGAGLVLSAMSSGIGPSTPVGTTSAATDPERILLAQSGAGDPIPAVRPVSYSEEQADRGQDRFTRDCEECHGKDLKGGVNGGAVLRGLAFEQKYMDGAPASGLYLFMSTAMPPNSPGRFSPGQYADLMAYILKRNGFRPGMALPSDIEELDYLIMEK